MRAAPRDLAQRSAQGGAQLLALGLRGGAGQTIGQVVQRMQLAGHQQAGGRPAGESSLSLVESDAVEPGEEARASLKARQRAPGAQEGLLGDLVCLELIEPEPAQRYEQPVGVAHDELLEGVHVALAGARDKRLLVKVFASRDAAHGASRGASSMRERTAATIDAATGAPGRR